MNKLATFIRNQTWGGLALLAVMPVVTFAVAVFGYALLFDPVTPVRVARIVHVLGPSCTNLPVQAQAFPCGIVRRPQADAVFIERELCLSRDANGTIHRQWIEGSPDENLLAGVTTPYAVAAGRSNLVFNVAALDNRAFRGGCRKVIIRVEVPSFLPPGVYTYRANVRWCNWVLSCASTILPDVRVEVQGDAPGYGPAGYGPTGFNPMRYAPRWTEVH